MAGWTSCYLLEGLATTDTKGNLQMKKPEIVWFLTKGGVPPPLLRFGTFPVFSPNFFNALK